MLFKSLVTQTERSETDEIQRYKRRFMPQESKVVYIVGKRAGLVVTKAGLSYIETEDECRQDGIKVP